MPNPGADVERARRIVERHRLLQHAIVEMDAAAAARRDQNQLGLAMTMPAAPLAGREMVQPEQPLGLERQALAELEEVHPAARVGRAWHVDPAAVAGGQGVGHAGRVTESLRHCMYTTPLSATNPPTI